MGRGCTSAVGALNGEGVHKCGGRTKLYEEGVHKCSGLTKWEGVHKCGGRTKWGGSAQVRVTKWGGGAQVPFKGPKKSQAPRKVSILCTGTI